MSQENIVKFYKYLSLSKQDSFKYLRNYLKQMIWLTPLKNFNDPFEGRFKFTSITSDYVLSDPVLFDGILKKHHENGDVGLTAEMLRERLSSAEFCQELKNNSKFVKDIFSDHGVLCLTTDCADIPMWAYYADDHRGCCIEFELNFSHIQEQAGIADTKIREFMDGISNGSEILSFHLGGSPYEFVFLKVKYDANLPTIDHDQFYRLTSRYDQIEYVVKRSVGVKFIEWSHENEYRLIANANSADSGLLGLERFAPFLKVTGVIIGSRILPETDAAVRSLCNEYEVNLHVAECSESAYEIAITN